MSQNTLPCLSPEANSIITNSVYEHYKGMRYKVLGVARHSETLEELIVYQALYGECDLWVRPLDMFLEKVTIDGIIQPRFKFIQSLLQRSSIYG
ncbi:MAG: DUF1653 domain-containing protein [Chlamydiae bacterium]|nr:DUF1653 domain-containing protein [Chlamydiota bacterium]